MATSVEGAYGDRSIKSHYKTVELAYETATSNDVHVIFQPEAKNGKEDGGIVKNQTLPNSTRSAGPPNGDHQPSHHATLPSTSRGGEGDGPQPPKKPLGIERSVSMNEKERREKKIGHRRVDEEGQVTFKKIQTSQIMSSIQLGIQHSIGSLANVPRRDLLLQDFTTVETLSFPREGSQHTPAHHFSDFRFKTYAAIGFRFFREAFQINPDDFLMSMCNAPLRELSNPGQSGSIFYLTPDDEFILKTVMHKEGEFLQKLLPGYYLNLQQNPKTLLPKFFGLYCYQCNQKNVRLVVMNNLLPSSIKFHEKYDLKGSTYKRKASKAERNKNSPTYKDLDFMERHPEGILLEAETYKALVQTVERDCRVLESFKIMDYSLLVGIHNLDEAEKERSQAEGQEGTAKGAGDASPPPSPHEGDDDPNRGLGRTRSINRHRLPTAMESIQAEFFEVPEDGDNLPPGGIPARSHRGERLLLFLGIIDILQSYHLRKKLEHTLKAMVLDGDTVSVHRPSFYSKRFLQFMTEKVFKKIPSLDHPEVTGRRQRKFRNLVSSYLALRHSPSKRRPHFNLRAGQLLPQQQISDEAAEDDKPPGSLGKLGSPSATVYLPFVLQDRPPVSRPSAAVASQAPRSNLTTTSPPGPPLTRGVKLQRSVSRPEEAQQFQYRAVVPAPAQAAILEHAPAAVPPATTEPGSSTHSTRSASSTSGVGSTLRTATWTPPLSTDTGTWNTEGTPSYTESSSSEGCPSTPGRSRRVSSGLREDGSPRQSRPLHRNTPGSSSASTTKASPSPSTTKASPSPRRADPEERSVASGHAGKSLLTPISPSSGTRSREASLTRETEVSTLSDEVVVLMSYSSISIPDDSALSSSSAHSPLPFIVSHSPPPPTQPSTTPSHTVVTL